jgi:adenylate cyclase
LAEFGSVVQAVACAVAIQEGMAVRNEAVPGDRRIVFRIGVHLGDVMVEGDDLYGDGVNVAARLEGLAEPGGICISRQVHDQVETKLDLTFENMGEQQVKNIARPIHVWRVRREGEGQEPRTLFPAKVGRVSRPGAVLIASLVVAIVAAAAWWQPWKSSPTPVCSMDDPALLSDRPSIAVLPFENLGTDPKQEYLGYGFAEDLITDLSKICGLFVIPSEESFPYRDQDISLAASELGVRYLVKGSVRRDGERMRINVKLIDATSGAQIWADRYDRDQNNMFSLLDDVLEQIAGSMALKLSENERRRIAARGTDSFAAHDLYMQARRRESDFTCEGYKEAMALYQQALSIDPDYALVYGRMANILELGTRTQCSADTPADIKKAVELAEVGTKLDPRNPTLWWSLGRATARLRTPAALKRGIEAMQWAIELDPYFADAYAYLAILYVSDGRAADGRRSVETAMRLNPRYPFWYLFMRGVTGFCARDYESAVSDLEAARERSPTAQFVRWFLAAAYAKAGRTADAEWEMDELAMSGFNGTIATIIATQPIQDPACLANYREGLRIAGIPEK